MNRGIWVILPYILQCHAFDLVLATFLLTNVTITIALL